MFACKYSFLEFSEIFSCSNVILVSLVTLSSLNIEGFQWHKIMKGKRIWNHWLLHILEVVLELLRCSYELFTLRFKFCLHFSQFLQRQSFFIPMYKSLRYSYRQDIFDQKIIFTDAFSCSSLRALASTSSFSSYVFFSSHSITPLHSSSRIRVSPTSVFLDDLEATMLGQPLFVPYCCSHTLLIFTASARRRQNLHLRRTSKPLQPLLLRFEVGCCDDDGGGKLRMSDEQAVLLPYIATAHNRAADQRDDSLNRRVKSLKSCATLLRLLSDRQKIWNSSHLQCC